MLDANHMYIYIYLFARFSLRKRACHRSTFTRSCCASSASASTRWRRSAGALPPLPWLHRRIESLEAQFYHACVILYSCVMSEVDRMSLMILTGCQRGAPIAFRHCLGLTQDSCSSDEGFLYLLFQLKAVWGYRFETVKRLKPCH